MIWKFNLDKQYVQFFILGKILHEIRKESKICKNSWKLQSVLEIICCILVFHSCNYLHFSNPHDHAWGISFITIYVHVVDFVWLMIEGKSEGCLFHHNHKFKSNEHTVNYGFSLLRYFTLFLFNTFYQYNKVQFFTLDIVFSSVLQFSVSN